MPDPKPVVVPIQVRWRDLDALGHVNNAVYSTYLETARFAYVHAAMGSVGDVDPITLLDQHFQFILAGLQISYRSPALITDKLEVSLYVSRVGRKSFDFAFRMTDARSGRLLAEGVSTQVWYDYSTQTSLPVPEEAIMRMEVLQGAPIPRA